MSGRIRIILDGAHDGPANMARDEALLESAVATGSAAMRFYQWTPATVSLGYFQPLDAWEQCAADLSRFGLVRRPTGGGAILHADELTYSLAVRDDLDAIRHTPNRLYEIAHEVIRAALAARGLAIRFHGGESEGNTQRGPFFCFARRHRYDLVVGDDKVVGSAQRRRAGAILQHGSIILARIAPQPCTGVNDHLAEPISTDQLAGELARPLADALGLSPVGSELTQDELKSAISHAERYGGQAWTARR